MDMNDNELERVESLFQETVALEKQFKSLLERQPPFSIDVTTLLQTYHPQSEDSF
jgi:hypothetical protein